MDLGCRRSEQGTRVALHKYALSSGNPDRAALETAYRDFEAATRPYFCTVSIYNPANPANMNPLVFFTHPCPVRWWRGMTLSAGLRPIPCRRHPSLLYRRGQTLMSLAPRCAELGDKALAYETAQARPQ